MSAEEVQVTVAILPEVIGVLFVIGLVYLADLVRMVWRDFR